MMPVMRVGNGLRCEKFLKEAGEGAKAMRPERRGARTQRFAVLFLGLCGLLFAQYLSFSCIKKSDNYASCVVASEWATTAPKVCPC